MHGMVWWYGLVSFSWFRSVQNDLTRCTQLLRLGGGWEVWYLIDFSLFSCIFRERVCPKPPQTTPNHTKPRMMIIYDHHVGWSYMTIIYDDHTWSSHMIIIYDHRICSSYMIITYDHHIWSSYKTIIFDHHIWWSYKMIQYGHEGLEHILWGHEGLE